MKQRGTQRNMKRRKVVKSVGTVSPASSVTISGDHDDVSATEAGRELNRSARSIRRLAAAGKIPSFRTSSGHVRIRRADLDAHILDTSSVPAVPSRVANGREEVQMLSLELQQRRLQRDLQRLAEEDAEVERKRAEAVAAERARSQAALEQVRLQRAERDRKDAEDRKKQEEFERWQNWADGWIQYALVNFVSSLDGRTRFAGEIQTLVQQALERLGPLGPSRPRAIVEQVVIAATWQAFEPWIREQQKKQELATAETQRLLAQMRSNAVQREREGYLRFVVPYLMDLSHAPAPRGVDFEGKMFDYAERIKAEIKPQLINDPSVNSLNAEHRVQQLVDQWIAIELRTEQPEMKG